MKSTYPTYQYHGVNKKPKHTGRRFATVILIILFLVSICGGTLHALPVASVSPTKSDVIVNTEKKLDVAWPGVTQAAVGAVGYGVLDETKNSKPIPTASTAKIFTALMVVKAKPIKEGEAGPTITFTADDVAVYQAYLKKLGVVYPVTAGQQMTQSEALNVMLIISANNFADKLATWAYGSVDAYAAVANEYLSGVGLTNTHISDASGFSPQTVSTARDLTLAAQMLMNNPVLAKIVNTSSATIGGVKLQSTNKLLGSEGVIGVKTGNTDEAGGCFVIAKKVAIDASHSVIMLSVIMGSVDVPAAMQQAKSLATQAQQGFSYKTFVSNGTQVAKYQSPWGQSVAAITNQDISGLVWRGATLTSNINVRTIKAGEPHSTNVGSFTITNGAETYTSSVVLSGDLTNPPIDWRLYRRYR